MEPRHEIEVLAQLVSRNDCLHSDEVFHLPSAFLVAGPLPPEETGGNGHVGILQWPLGPVKASKASITMKLFFHGHTGRGGGLGGLLMGVVAILIAQLVEGE